MTSSDYRLAARTVYGGILAVSVAVLAIAYAAERWAGIEPCILCLYERVPFGLSAVAAGMAMAFKLPPPWDRLVVQGCAGVFALGSVLALYHVGVEWQWWSAPGACSGNIPDAGSLATLRGPGPTPALRPCTEDVWRLLGLSLAGWNVLASAGLALVCLIASHRLQPRGLR
jgi:disulfide bond formation protein DsbB